MKWSIEKCVDLFMHKEKLDRIRYKNMINSFILSKIMRLYKSEKNEETNKENNISERISKCCNRINNKHLKK